jgi:iron complex transport system ATP-binding protein
MGRTAYSGMFSSPGREDVEIAENALKSVGMLKFKDRIYTKLSGGEAQLIKIARAIAQDTQLIVFDEPTSQG